MSLITKLSFTSVAQMKSSWHFYFLYYSSMIFSAALETKNIFFSSLEHTGSFMNMRKEEDFFFSFAQISTALSEFCRLN